MKSIVIIEQVCIWNEKFDKVHKKSLLAVKNNGNSDTIEFQCRTWMQDYSRFQKIFRIYLFYLRYKPNRQKASLVDNENWCPNELLLTGGTWLLAISILILKYNWFLQLFKKITGPRIRLVLNSSIFSVTEKVWKMNNIVIPVMEYTS